ncbi:hypothetical protein BH10PSE17_BH10PSE17_04850 [soil metagenome]
MLARIRSEAGRVYIGTLVVVPRTKVILIKPIAVAALFALVSLCSPQLALADDVQDIDRLLNAQKYDEALVKIDAGLVARPRDPQLRFLRGVTLQDQKKLVDATAVFVSLTQDYPELPEPYNNLAVIYAANSEYEKARVSLETAIRLSPTYSVAYENLGDVYVRLAEGAYTRVGTLDPANAFAQRKLRLARELVIPPPPAPPRTPANNPQ